MFDKSKFDRSLYDRDTGDGATIYADIQGSVTLLSNIKVKASTSANIPMQMTVSGSVGVRVPLSADIAASMSVEAGNLFVHTQLFLNPINVAGTISAAVGLLAPISAVLPIGADFASEFLKAHTRLAQTNIPIGSTVIPDNLGLRFPIQPADVPFSGDMAAEPYLFVPIHTGDITMDGDVKCAPIFEPGAAKLELENLNLAPGDELIIDTDVIEVLLNGIPDVDFVTGDSEFFELIPGTNRLIFMDGETGRELSVTIVWSNRWL
jgi:hypothetical protein